MSGESEIILTYDITNLICITRVQLQRTYIISSTCRGLSTHRLVFTKLNKQLRIFTPRYYLCECNFELDVV